MSELTIGRTASSRADFRLAPRARALLALLLSLLAAMPAPLQASLGLSVRKSDGRSLISISARDERIGTVADQLAVVLQRPVSVASGRGGRVTFSVSDATPHAAVDALGRAAGLYVLEAGAGFRLQAQEPGVTLDVKEVDIRKILQSMKKQCGIRNLLIDPAVQGNGTFLFKNVPCHTAFEVVTRTMGLGSEFAGNVANVGPRQ